MNASSTDSPSFVFWLIAAIGLIWNAFGIVTFVQTVGLSPADIAKLPEAEQTLLLSAPSWVNVVYGIAVFAGTLGCVLLMLKTMWSIPVLSLSLLAILAQMGQAIFFSDLLEIRGQSAVFLPTAIIMVAIFLLWYANQAKSKRYLS